MVVCALGASGSGCSDPTDLQPHPGSCPPFDVIAARPLNQELNVPTNTAVELTFSDAPDPDSFGPDTVYVTSGPFWYLGQVSVDLLTRTVRWRRSGPLTADISYRVTVLPGAASLRHCHAPFQQRTFRTGPGPVPVPPPPPPPSLAADVLPIFAERCAGARCHRADDGACLDAPAKALSLCDRDAYRALLGEPSREVSELSLVRPYEGARSYLLRKLIPDGRDGGPLPGVIGQRQPPGPPLDERALRTISDWIDLGAHP